MAERRQNIRVSATLKVSYKIANTKSYLQFGSFSDNLGSKGMCLPTVQQLEPGVILQLWIYLQEYEKPIVAIGKVVWVRKREKDLRFPFEMGIEFIKIHSREQTKIIEYLHERIKEETQEISKGI